MFPLNLSRLIFKPNLICFTFMPRHYPIAAVIHSRRSGGSRNSVYTCTNIPICALEGVQHKSHLHGTAIPSVKAWPPCCVHHFPAIFFRHPLLIALSFPQKKNRCTLQKQTILLNSSHFSLNCYKFETSYDAECVL